MGLDGVRQDTNYGTFRKSYKLCPVESGYNEICQSGLAEICTSENSD